MVFRRKTLNQFSREHADAEQPLNAWYSEALKARWKPPHDVKKEYPKASILGEGLVVFDVCHNKYRLAVRIQYGRGWVFILFLGTHREYDLWNQKRSS